MVQGHIHKQCMFLNSFQKVAPQAPLFGGAVEVSSRDLGDFFHLFAADHLAGLGLEKVVIDSMGCVRGSLIENAAAALILETTSFEQFIRKLGDTQTAPEETWEGLDTLVAKAKELVSNTDQWDNFDTFAKGFVENIIPHMSVGERELQLSDKSTASVEVLCCSAHFFRLGCAFAAANQADQFPKYIESLLRAFDKVGNSS